jgi:hypothetical protein
MFRKYLSLVLVASLSYVANAAPAYAQSNAGKEPQLSERVKEAVLRLGHGPEVFVRVGLSDRMVLGGYIDEAGEDSFTVIDELTGRAATISYSGVKRIMGVNSLTRVTITVGVGRLSRLALKYCWTRRKPSTILQF